MRRTSSRVIRLREWLGWFAATYPIHCYICGERINPAYLLIGSAEDGVLLHHKEHDRTKNEAGDVAPVHRGCHRSYHHNWDKHKKSIRTAKAIEIWGIAKVESNENLQADQHLHLEASNTKGGIATPDTRAG